MPILDGYVKVDASEDVWANCGDVHILKYAGTEVIACITANGYYTREVERGNYRIWADPASDPRDSSWKKSEVIQRDILRDMTIDLYATNSTSFTPTCECEE